MTIRPPSVMTKEAFDALPDPNTKLAAWRELKEAADAFKALEAHARSATFGMFFNHPDGTQNRDLGNGWSLKGVATVNYNLDHKALEGGGDTALEKVLDTIDKLGPAEALLAERLVKWKPELAVGEYKKLAPESPVRKLIDSVLTTKPGTPTMELIEPKAT